MPIFSAGTWLDSSAYGIDRMLAQATPTSANDRISHAGVGTAHIDRKPMPPRTSDTACTALRFNGLRAAMKLNSNATSIEDRP